MLRNNNKRRDSILNDISVTKKKVTLNTKLRRKKAYSLLEVIVSLSIIGVAMTILMSFLVLSLKVSTLSLSRSIVREEIATISNQIERDIRNASTITSCQNSSCNLLDDRGDNITWSLVPNPNPNNNCRSTAQIKKTITTYDPLTGNATNTDLYVSSCNVTINNLDFTTGYTQNISISNQNIIITINGSHSNTSTNINNIIKQTSVSTRNLNIVK